MLVVVLPLQVKRCIQEESVRIRKYLHPFTCHRIEQECHLWLICEENINFLSDSCSEIVQREQWKGNSVPPVYTESCKMWQPFLFWQ